MNRFDYFSPESLESAAREFMAGENMALIAGGTDLVPLLKSGVKKPARLLNLARVRELKELTLRRDGLFIGSMVTLRELIENSIVRKHLPTLAESARWVASPQIRNQGTVGGNLLQEKRCLYFNQSDSWRKIPACFALGGRSAIKFRVRRFAGPFIIRTSRRFCWPSMPAPKSSMKKDRRPFPFRTSSITT